MPKREPERKGPDWPPEKTLKVLRQQLAELETIKSLPPLEAYKRKEGWTQVTQATIVHGFGERSQNLTNFQWAHYAARHKDQLVDFRAVTEQHEIALTSTIRELELMLPEPEAMQTAARPKPAHQGIVVFISHSSKDAELALALIELLKAGLGLPANQILCSSVDGYRLPVGINTEAKLREEVNAARIVIGLITPSSLASAFVMFELGARWGANQFLAPLLAGVRPSEITGPLNLLNALSASNEAQLHQLLEDISQKVGLPLQNAASYVRYVSAVRQLADRITASVAEHSAALVARPDVGKKRELRLSLTVIGTPPSPQMLSVQANQVVKAVHLDYLLSNGPCIASDNLNLEGETFNIPIEDHQLVKLWNTHRPDRNPNDHSGPAKLRVTLAVNGVETPYTLPIQMDAYFHQSTQYKKLTGAETFRGD
jgi:hypothetical protein